MEVDPVYSESQILRQKAENLQALITGEFSSSVSKLAGSSRGLPTEKDFYFYYLFDEFKSPLDEIAATSREMLEKIGSCGQFWPSGNTYPADDMDDGYSWLVNVNDDILERFDASIDEFSKTVNAQGKSGSCGKEIVDEDGFQLVSRKKKPFLGGICVGGGNGTETREKEAIVVSPTTVRVAEKDKKVSGTKPKVPFHIPSIRRPQDDYNILVDNSNKPFEHVWLQRSEDGSRIIHPLEKLSVSDFVDRKTVEPVKPPLLEATPFKFVQSVEELKEMVAKLREVDEFAVDLEHNQYRSFQGLTCLMQISTRTEDFIVDTLKLRVFVGPYLRELFKDPNKKKVMHGADRDVTWLQRDFGIYICNLFDTGQASRVLKLERNSLEYLLHHFCGVTANKEYQNAEWRLRPLPLEMIRYAREDTHYLLYIHDLMRVRLLSESTENENSLSLLAEVYQRSYDVCMQLYEKELLSETSYLHLYGLQAANFNAQQLAIVSGLYEWRDIVARAEDESTGYILPNKALLEIAKQMPVTTGKLRRLVRHKNPYIERNLSSVVNIIRHSIQHSSQFEAVVEQLRETRAEVASESIEVGAESSQVSHPPETCQTQTTDDNGALGETNSVIQAEKVGSQATDESAPRDSLSRSLKQDVGIGNDSRAPNLSFSQSEKSTGATVQILKKPSPMLGALFGSLTSAKRVYYSKKDKEVVKLEQIKSSVDLPFHSFNGGEVQKGKQATKEEPIKTPSSPPITAEVSTDERAVTGNEESVIPLGEESSSDEEETLPSKKEGDKANPELTEEELSGQMSLADLSSSFKKCLDSMNQKQQVEPTRQSKGSQGLTQFKPFDYVAAREEMESWGSAEERGTEAGSKLDSNREVRIRSRVKERGKGGSSSSSSSATTATTRDKQDDGAGLLPQGRRRQVFPASGNRSATFRSV